MNVSKTYFCSQHRLSQENVEEAVTAAPVQVAEPDFCPFWSCLPNLDTIVALRASIVAFNAPQGVSLPGDDQGSDLYSLCTTRCCQVASVFAAAQSPVTPTEIASSVRSASLLSPDSSGLDSFEGPLALHTACDVLHMASWRTFQVADGPSATHDERLCPVVLMNSMAAAAALLSDMQM